MHLPQADSNYKLETSLGLSKQSGCISVHIQMSEICSLNRSLRFSYQIAAVKSKDRDESVHEYH